MGSPPTSAFIGGVAGQVNGAPRLVRRKVPLKFWLGPIRLWTVSLDVEVESCPVDPFDDCRAPTPDFESLAPNLDGLYQPSEPLEREFPILALSPSAIRYLESSYQRRFADLTTGFDTYLSKFSTKTRSSMRRKLRKFAKASSGEIDWRVYRSAHEMQQFHGIARALSSRTYQEKLFDAGLPEDPEFLERMILLAQNNNVRGFILFLQGIPVSYLYLPVEEGRVIYSRLGFDPQYSEYSPGTVLHLLALEQLFAEKRYRLLDFTEGEGLHKKAFATHERLCGNVFYLRSTKRNWTIVRLHLLVREIDRFVDRLVTAIKLRTRLKHIMRGQRGKG